MKMLRTAVSIGAIATLIGCNQGTSGGPGATNPPSETSIVGQADDTFSISVPSTDLNQGESKALAVSITRGDDFSEDVSLMLNDLPAGVTVEPARPLIGRGETEANFLLKASGDAALGDFTIKVVGRPTKGADAVTEASISVASQQEPAEVEQAADDAATAMREEYTDAMQAQLDQYEERRDTLKAQADEAEGQAKSDLDSQFAMAQTKIETAERKLDELESAPAERWDSAKAEVAAAFEDLQQTFP